MGALEVKEPMRDAGRIEGQVEALHLTVIEIRKARQAEVGGGLKIGRPEARGKAGPATDDPGDRAADDAGEEGGHAGAARETRRVDAAFVDGESRRDVGPHGQRRLRAVLQGAVP